MILTTNGWDCHNLGYTLKYSQRWGEWIVRDMDGDERNWSHPPETKIKIIIMVSGNNEDNGMVQPDDYYGFDETTEASGRLWTRSTTSA